MITDLSPPGTEPISLSGAKAFLRIDHSDEDALIRDLIQKAREQVETLTARRLISRPIRLSLSSPFKRCVYLNIAPITEVTAVTLHLFSGETETVALESLDINLRANPVTLKPKKRGLFQYHNRTDIQSMTIDVVAGYGDAAGDVPMPLRQAMLLLVGQGWESRNGKDMPAIPMMVDALIMPYRSLKL